MALVDHYLWKDNFDDLRDVLHLARVLYDKPDADARGPFARTFAGLTSERGTRMGIMRRPR